MLDILYEKLLDYYKKLNNLGMQEKDKEISVNDYSRKLFNHINSSNFFVLQIVDKENNKKYYQAYYDKKTKKIQTQHAISFNVKDLNKFSYRIGFLNYDDITVNVKSKMNDNSDKIVKNSLNSSNENIVDVTYKYLKKFFLNHYNSYSIFREAGVDSYSRNLCYDLITKSYTLKNLYVIKDNISKEYMQCYYDKKIKKFVTRNNKELSKKEFKKLYVRNGCLDYNDMRYNVGLEIFKNKGKTASKNWLRTWLREPEVYVIINSYEKDLFDVISNDKTLN